MNCEQCAELAGDAVDSTLSPAQEALLQEHCRGCEDCRELLNDLMKIRAVAATLEQRIPPPQLWSAIATKTIKATARRSVWVPLAAAAALIMMVGTAALFDIGPLRRRNPAAESPTELARSAASELQQAEQHYVNAITTLEQLTVNKQDALDPVVADQIARSLAIIDRAIGDSRAALKTEPNSFVAQTSLLEALRMKVALLQETVSLISEAERDATLPKS
jgi:predicted anti-sigma-YlaC factor YlaD